MGLWPNPDGPTGITSPVTVDPLEFQGATTFDKSAIFRNGGAGATVVKIDSANGLIQLGSNAGTYLYAIGGNGTIATDSDFTIRSNTAKLKLGASGDANLYRSAANTIKTDGALVVGDIATVASWIVMSGGGGDGSVRLLGGARLIGGTGSPNGAVTAPKGSMFLRGDGAAGSFIYVNQDNAQTWAAIA